ncbi:Outer membrane porin protein 32 [compost metagenome]
MRQQHRLLLALAATGAVGAAHGQSSVTVFGSIDLNFTYSKAGNASTKAMDQGGYLLPSRLGFRGVEDLGGGLAAGFWLETAVLPDTGETQGGFGRRSTVSLMSKDLGELRLGRDYTPTFWNVSSFSPFGTVGVGGSSNIVEGWPLGLGRARTQARASNSAGYFLPRGLGGLYGQFMFAAAEGAQGAGYRGGRLGYESGPVNVAAAYGQTAIGPDDYRTVTVGGSYDFGVVKAYANYLRHRLARERQTNALIGASVPIGAGQIRVSFARSERSGPGLETDGTARQFAIGYAHHLSKRTTLYSAYSRISNRGNAAYVVADSSPAGMAGRRSSGIQLGVNHAF